MVLTLEEIAIIKSRLPFFDMNPGEERLEAISDFMADAERLYMIGIESFLHRITAVDDEGTEATVQYETGDSEVGLSDGWVIDGTLKEVSHPGADVKEEKDDGKMRVLRQRF